MPYRRDRSPYWWISWQDPSGRRRACSSGSKEYQEAKRLEHERRATAKVRVQPASPGGHTVDDVLYEYLAAVRYERGAWAAKRLLEHMEGRPIARIEPAHVAAYKAERRAQGASDGTVGKELGTLQSAIRHCRRELGWDIPNPIEGRMPPKPPGRLRWLTREEAARLMRAARANRRAPYLPDLILFALHTGLRRAELLGLEWSRVDFRSRLLWMAPEHQKGKRHSSVPLNRTALMVLRRRRSYRDSKHPDSAWVFTGQGGKPVSSIRKPWARTCEAAGLSEVTPHVLRHTCAAWLVQSGAPIRTVSEFLRHRSITTTMIYAHLGPDSTRVIAEML